MAAGKDGAENMAATELIIPIQDSISSGLLQRRDFTCSYEEGHATVVQTHKMSPVSLSKK